jgi:hypothetical protein
MKDLRNITKSQLGKIEAGFLAKAGAHPTFSLAFARQILGHSEHDPTVPKRGKYNRGWGLLLNLEIQP